MCAELMPPDTPTPLGFFCSLTTFSSDFIHEVALCMEGRDAIDNIRTVSTLL